MLLASRTGCLRIHDTRGKFLEDDKIAAVKPGMSQAEVTKILGTPSSYALFRDDTWFYMGVKESHVAFVSPRLDETKILKVTFDKEGKVISSLLDTPEAFQEIDISSRKTNDLSHNRTFLQSIFGNVGRHSTGGAVKPRVRPGSN